MSDSRIVTMRKSENLDASVLDIPFSFIQYQFGYPVESILRKLNTVPLINLGKYPDTFPHTIKEFHWIQAGSPGSKPWAALGVLTNGLYFFYTAQTQNTPKLFLDGGHMNLWVSFRYSDLIQYAMTLAHYNDYINETV